MDKGANGAWRELAERGGAPHADVAGTQASREASLALSDVEEAQRDSDSDFAVGSDGGADDPRDDADNSAADSLGSSGYRASHGCGCACCYVRRVQTHCSANTTTLAPLQDTGRSSCLESLHLRESTGSCSCLGARLRARPHPQQEAEGRRRGQAGQARAYGPQRQPQAA